MSKSNPIKVFYSLKTRLIITIIFLLTFYGNTKIYSKEINQSDSLKSDTVLIGAFVSSIHDFKISDNTINADIHLWCIYKNPIYDFKNELEFVNCNKAEFNGNSVVDIKGGKWFYTKALVQARQHFSTKNYPFDKQELIFPIESSEYSTKDLIFLPDLKNSNIDPLINKSLDEFNLNSVLFNTENNIYQTSFGDTEATNNTNSRFNILLKIERKHPWLILFKLITGIIVAFLTSACVFWIKPINVDPRFGLCVGGLFAVIGNKYIVENIVPSNNEITLLDSLHLLTLAYIFLIIVLSVISLHIYEKGGDKYQKISKRFDLISFFGIVTLYLFSFTLIFNTYLN